MFLADEVQQGEAAISRRPPNAVAASCSILPVEGLTEYKHEASKDFSPKITLHGNDAPICKETQVEKYQGTVLATATEPGNGSKDVSLQKEFRGTLSLERPEVTSKPPSVREEHSNGKGCAETKYSGPTEAYQLLQSESEDPNFGSRGMPASFSGLFQSILASENPSSQLVETASQPNWLSAASSAIPIIKGQAVTDIVNTTTRLMLSSLNQPLLRPGFLQVENARESRNRMEPNTAVAAVEAWPASLPIRSASQSSYREARVASAANTVSAAASAAKSAVQAAEASIEALAQLGINNGSLYQGRNSFVNPRPLKVLFFLEQM